MPRDPLGRKHRAWLDTQPLQVIENLLQGSWQANHPAVERAYRDYLQKRRANPHRDLDTSSGSRYSWLRSVEGGGLSHAEAVAIIQREDRPSRRKPIPLLAAGAAEGLMAQEAVRRYGKRRGNPAPPGDPDEVLATELVNHTMNDADLYRQRVQPFVRSYARKRARGVYKEDLAVKGLSHLFARDAYKSYWSQYGGGGRAPDMDAATKWEYGVQLLEWISDEIDFEVNEMAAKKAARGNPRPGKFEGSGKTGEELYEMVQDGWVSEELGDVEGFGWYGLLINTELLDAPYAIVEENSVGFFDYTAYVLEADARAAWATLEDDYREWAGDMDKEGIPYENPGRLPARKAPGRKRKPSKVVRPASKSYYCRKCMGYHRRASKIGKKHSKSDSSPRRPPRTLDVSCNRCGSIMRNQKQVREHFRDHPDHNDMTIP